MVGVSGLSDKIRFNDQQYTPASPIPQTDSKQVVNDSSHYLYQTNINILNGQQEEIDEFEQIQDIADESDPMIDLR